MLEKIIPKEILGLSSTLSDWFKGSGIVESLEEKGTTGIHHIITRINNRPATLAVAISYLTEDEIRQLEAMLLEKTQSKKTETEKEE